MKVEKEKDFRHLWMYVTVNKFIVQGILLNVSLDPFLHTLYFLYSR